MHDRANRLGIPIFDPLVDFRKLSRDEAEQLFIGAREAPRFGGAWHYNEKGNRYVGDAFYRWLIVRPEVQARLAARSAR